jgi:ABC-type bacteriocin/lantibiotic exporter with double-glycine peptidase domain
MIPYHKQKKEWWCGPAVVQMVLAAHDIQVSQPRIARIMKTTQARGTPNKNMTLPFRRYELSTRIFKGKEALMKSLKRKEIIIVNYYHLKDQVGHFAIVKHIKNKRMTLVDPSEGPNHTMLLKEFLDNWYGSDKDKKWGMSIAN